MSPLVRSMMTPVRRKKASDSEIGTQMIKEPFCRNYGNPIALKRGFNKALRFGISEVSRPGALCIGIIGYGVRYKAEERGVAVLRR